MIQGLSLFSSLPRYFPPNRAVVFGFPFPFRCHSSRSRTAVETNCNWSRADVHKALVFIVFIRFHQRQARKQGSKHQELETAQTARRKMIQLEHTVGGTMGDLHIRQPRDAALRRGGSQVEVGAGSGAEERGCRWGLLEGREDRTRGHSGRTSSLCRSDPRTASRHVLA